MKIRVFQGRPCYPMLLGGAARLMHRLMGALMSEPNVCVSMLSRLGPRRNLDSFVPKCEDWERLGISGVEIQGHQVSFDIGYPCEATTEFWPRFHHEINVAPPALAIALLEGASRILAEARHRSVPSMLYIVDAEYSPDEVARAADAGVVVVCLSSFLATHVRSTTGREAFVLYPIIDQLRNLASLHDPRESGYVLMVNAYPQKGIKTFLAVAEALPDVRFLLQESWPMSAMQLTSLRQRLRSLPNIRFQRAVADMRPVYEGASLLVVPSVWQEGFGMVCVEAQCCGVPVIASHRGGLPESVGSGGCLIEDHENPVAWASVIENVLETSSLYERLCTEAAKSATRAEFSQPHVLCQFWKIYEECRTRTS